MAKSENTLSSRQLQEAEQILTIVGNTKPFDSESFGDDEVLFYDLNNGCITYAYSLEGKIFCSSMLTQSSNANPGTSPEQLQKLHRNETIKKIVKKLNGQPVKETFQID